MIMFPPNSAKTTVFITPNVVLKLNPKSTDFTEFLAMESQDGSDPGFYPPRGP